ncbi:hypothetical protein E1J53_0016465 [Lewinella sp. W8]|nr:hypothetical protein [Lewinella sp. W8]
MTATTIDEVIAALDEIIRSAKETENPLGYFAALYRKVTIRVKEKIAEGYFDDGARMERLDVIFANRYLEAYAAYQSGRPTTDAWREAFVSGKNPKLIVLQHLLLGMNAHINLDLGIAAVEVSGDDDLEGLHNDFNKINSILSSLVEDIQGCLSRIWPGLVWILKLTRRADDLIVDFSMEVARDGAWKFARELNAERADRRPAAIRNRDQKIARLVRVILAPGWVERTVIRLVRWTELGRPAQKITILEEALD